MNGYAYDDGTGDPNGQQDPNDAPMNPRDLRAQLAAMGQKLKERDDALAALQSQVRQASVKELFASSGLPPKAVALFPKDQDPTVENVKAFVDTYGDLFQVSQPAGAPAGTQPASTQAGQPPAGQQTPPGQATTQTVQNGGVIPADVAALIESLRKVTTGETGVTTQGADSVAAATMAKANADATDLTSFIAGLQSGAASPPTQ